jgi:hypothetical protein
LFVAHDLASWTLAFNRRRTNDVSGTHSRAVNVFESPPLDRLAVDDRLPSMSPMFIRRTVCAALMLACSTGAFAQERVAPGALPSADRPFGTLRDQAVM